jgi:elongator complex protein 2
MGQFLGNKNAYFNVVTDDKFKYLVVVNYIGSALIWLYNIETKKFSLRPSFNGHSNEVKDIDWNHTGNFLVSVSKDQTTRIMSKNICNNIYHEISRAQIHGYDLNAVSVLKVNDGLIDIIACGADEKVIRIIEPPACFANYLNNLTRCNLHLFFPNVEE